MNGPLSPESLVMVRAGRSSHFGGDVKLAQTNVSWLGDPKMMRYGLLRGNTRRARVRRKVRRDPRAMDLSLQRSPSAPGAAGARYATVADDFHLSDT